MKTIPPEEVHYIAHLARINIDSEQLPRYTRCLSDILSLVSEMQKVDTEEISPMAHPLEVIQPLRADEVTEPNFLSSIETFAPEMEAGLFLVPQVIEE